MKARQLQIFIVGMLGALAVFFIVPHSVHAASKYWVGGTDNWNGTAANKWATTSGGSTTTTLPTSADNCFFDTNSTGTVTVASGNTGCGSIDFTGFTRTLTMSAALTVSGNVTLVSAMTISGSSALTVNTSSTLTSNGKTWPNSLTLSNANGTYALADDWTVVGNVTIGPDFNGVTTITFNGSTMYVGGSLTIGTQHPTVTGTTNIVLNGTGTLSGSGTAGALKNNLTINTTGTITIGDFYYNTGTFTYTTGTIIVATSTTFTAGGALVLPSGIPWYNLTLSGPSASYTIPASTTIRGSLSLSGQSATYTLLGDIVVPGNLTLGANNTGVAITTLNGFTLYVGGSMTLGNNQPITTGSTNIVLNGTGTWSGSTTGALRNNLTINTTGTISIVGTVGYNTGTLTYTTGTLVVGTSTLSIASGTTMNTPGVIWNNITFSGTAPVTLVSNLTVNGSTTISGATTLGGPGLLVFTASSTLAGSSALSTYNSFTFASGMANVYTGTLSFISTSTTVTSTLTSNGVPFAGSLTINSSNTVQLADALNVTSTKTLTLTAGRFDANNMAVTAGAFSSSNSNTRTLTMGSGTWTLNGNLDPWTATTATGFTLTPGSSTIKLTGAYTAAKTFAGGSLTYNNFWSALPTNAFAIQFTGSNTFNDFKLNASTTVKFTANTTTTVTTFTATGTSGNLITIDSITTGTHSLVKSGGGAILGDYLSIQHSLATPAKTWFAGLNSTNNQSTTTAGSGWYFTLMPPSDTTGVSGTITNRNVIISWIAPTTYLDGTALSNLASFSLYRDTDPAGSFTTVVGSQIASSTLSFTDPNPAIGTTVYYAVTSVSASSTESFKSSPTGAILLSVASVNGGGGPSSGGGTIAPPSVPTVTPSPNLPSSNGSVAEPSGAGTATTPLTPSTQSFFFAKNLKQGDTHADIFTLQKYLNAQGFAIAKSGPGSPGNETNFFGSRTKLALIKFQEAHRTEILAPAGLTKGTGYFGVMTRAWVNSHN